MKNLLLKIKLMFVSLFTFKKDAVAAEGPLSLDLQFFADPGGEPGEPGAGGEPNPNPNPEPTPPNPEPEPSADPKPKDFMIPKSRFDEVNNNYKTVKDQLDKILKEKEDADRKAKEKQGEYQSLYEQANQQLETYKTDFESSKSRVEALEGVMNSMLQSKLEGIPEEYHDLIPDNLSPEQKLDWITKAEAKGLFGKNNPDEPIGGPTNPGSQNTDFENMNAFQLLQAGYGTKK